MHACATLCFVMECVVWTRLITHSNTFFPLRLRIWIYYKVNVITREKQKAKEEKNQHRRRQQTNRVIWTSSFIQFFFASPKIDATHQDIWMAFLHIDLEKILLSFWYKFQAIRRDFTIFGFCLGKKHVVMSRVCNENAGKQMRISHSKCLLLAILFSSMHNFCNANIHAILLFIRCLS